MAFAITGPQFLNACALFIFPGCFYITALCIYRIFLHPYSRYPGPWMAKVTNLYAGYHAWKGDIHVDMMLCHEKYGKHVRYAPAKLIFNTQQAVQDIYGHSSNVGKSTAYNALVHRAPNILTCRDKAQHSRRRRLMSQGFSNGNLRILEPTILAQIRKLCDQLTRSCYQTGVSSVESPNSKPEAALQWSPAMDMSQWFDYLTFDIMSNIIYSADYDALGKDAYRWVPNVIGESNVRVSVLFQAAEVTFWRLDKRLFPAAIKARDMFVQFVAKTVSNHLALHKSGREAQDIFSFLSKAQDPDGGDALTTRELGAESATLIVAGSDTTSTAMAAMLHYLSVTPASYERLAKEVRETFDSTEEICTGTKLNSCTYLRACIDEALRICPSSGSAPWREALTGGATIDGQYIPAGYDVGVGIYALHHNPEYYPEPSVFKPERCMADDRVGNGIHGCQKTKMTYQPFSSGPRSCIGKGLALVELTLTMAYIMYTLDFRTVNPGRTMSQTEFRVRDHISARKEGPVLQFRRRV